MPEAVIPVKRLRENYITDMPSLLHVYAPRLRQRGFRIVKDAKGKWLDDGSIAIRREPHALLLSQTILSRLPDSDPALQRCLITIKRQEADAYHRVGELYALLLAANDDRADILTDLTIDLPEQGAYYADTFESMDNTDQIISQDRLRQRITCERVLLLFGLRQEPL